MLSLIIPIYNVETYLRECLESVVEQTYLDKEVILVDDGSTDDSARIAWEYANQYPYIHLISQENAGVSRARNAGLARAVGDFICFMDSDDYFPKKETLADMMTELLATDADVASFSWTVSYPNRQVHRLEESGLYTGHQAIEKQLQNRISISACNKLYKRSVVEGLEFLAGRHAEDQLFVYEVFERANKILCSESLCYVYRQRSNSITTTAKLTKKVLDVLYIKELIYERAVAQFPAFKSNEVTFFAPSVIGLKERLRTSQIVEEGVGEDIETYFERYFKKILFSPSVPLRVKLNACLAQCGVSKAGIKRIVYGKS